MKQAHAKQETALPGSTGSVSEFDRNWKDRREARYNHWVRGAPQNQIQLAFRSHWNLFREILAGHPGKTCLEVGAGRGSISSYFADNGYRPTLLDTSESILDVAKDIFNANGHEADFVVGNALALDFPDNSFDVVVSIGLLEHFEDIQTVLSEQVRVLKKGGTFLGYIVPERPDNIQRHWRWLNRVLKSIAKISGFSKAAAPKSDIYRSDYGSERYLPVIKKLGAEDILVTGVYPLPMISHSPEFPFSLLPRPVEYILTRIFETVLAARKILYKKNPWMCDERFGQAFLISFRKK
ncbi:MAG: class I SAM-dependent methyltransferase [Alphaproteobacteria bacterium]|nr:class I SAM-dependent methyltransferase [Alphaproteobacteria bacterium]